MDIYEEVYENYITYFYEGTLKRDDMRFLQRVKNRSALQFDFKLSNIDEVVSKLRLREFSYEEILNIDLLNFLFDHESDYSNQLSSFLSLLSEKTKKSIEFIDAFIEKSEDNIPKFINKLSKKWNKIWLFIEDESNYLENKIDKYFDLIIRYADIEDITVINESSDGAFKKYISNKKDFIKIYESDEKISKIKKVLLDLQVEFNSIEEIQEISDLWEFIYNESLYEINTHMISLILEHECNCSEDSLNQFNKAPYSIIKASKCQVLKSYVNSSIEVFVNNILLKVETEIEEKEENFIELLNNSEISEGNKEELIKKQIGSVSDISKIGDIGYWLPLFEQMKVIPIWSNIISYYRAYEMIDYIIVGFLNENFEVLSKTSLDEFDLSKEELSDLSKKIILAESLSNECLNSLLKSIPLQFSELDFSSLNRNKVRSLIETETLRVSPQSFQLLKNEKFVPLNINLIESDIDSFIKIFSNFSADESDLKGILNSKKISNTKKQKIINLFDPNNLEVDVELAELMLEVFLNNSPIEIPVQLSEKIVRKGKETSKKIKFLNSQIDFLPPESIALLVKALPYSYQKMNKSRNRTRIENTDYNLELCDKLLSIDFISSYKEIDRDTIRVNAKV